MKQMFRALAFAPCLMLVSGLVAPLAGADALPQVHVIGAAYAGDFASIPQRFPDVTEIDGFGSKTQAVDLLTQRVQTALSGLQPKYYSLTTDQISNLQTKDQAIDLALVINREDVLQTSYDINGQMVYKVFAQVRAQALYFDVVQSAIVKAIPISFAQIATFDHAPTHAEVLQCVDLALFGSDDRSGLLGQFVNAVESSQAPSSATKFFRVTDVSVSEKADDALGVGAGSSQIALTDLQNSIADTFAESLSAGQGVSFIPYAADYLVGNRIPLSLSNGSAFSLKLPSADYSVRLALEGAKKVLYGQSAAGKSLIYGALFKIDLFEPISGRHYLNADFKNGVVVKVPVTQTSDLQNDRFAYSDSIRELFERLSEAITAGGTDWSSKATSSPDINAQLQATKELLQSCK